MQRETGRAVGGRLGAAWVEHRGLLLGLAVITALAAVLRMVALTHGYPALTSPDEPVVVERAQLLLHGHLPDAYDWPTGSMLLLAGALRTVGVGFRGALDSTHFQYVFARWLFAGVSIALVPITGVLGALLASEGRQRRLWSWCPALLVAVGYTAVRLGRTLQPEELQSFLAVAGLICVLRFDSTRRRSWLIAGAGLAGLAAGTKYLGAIVLVPLTVSVLWNCGRGLRRRVADLALSACVSVAAFVLLVPATILAPSDLVTGLRFQFLHQQDGHLGYDGTSTGWAFHAGTAVPGTWGWPITILSAVGLGIALASGTRLQRLAALYVVVAFTVLGASRVEFPHYVLLYLPVLGCFAVLPLLVLFKSRPLAALGLTSLATTGAVVALLVPTGLADLRLVRASQAIDTRTLATPLVARLNGRVVKDAYTDPSGVGEQVGTVGTHPELTHCACYVVLSSFMEDRYRREPERYAAEIRVYDHLRRSASVVTVIKPSVDLSYRWDLLPQWGADLVPLSGRQPTVGPTITILKLPD